MPVSEGHVYRAHSEGHACRARGIRMDYLETSVGPDKRVPPAVGGARLSCPLKRDGSSNVIQRT